MAWLCIDTHEQGHVRFAWLDGGRVVKRVEREGRASILLPLIVKDLGKMTITGLCVVAGPGSFSAVRGGVLDANLIARMFRVPLVSITPADTRDLEALAGRIASGDVTASAYVAPVYDQEPNITVPRISPVL